MKKKIYILDCGFGNIESVANAINFLGYKCEIVRDLKDKDSNTHLILPGVGNFYHASKKIKKLNLKNKIKKYLDKGGFFLGICIGMQLLFKYGEEERLSEGLNFFESTCVSFKKSNKFNLPLPHIGFSKVTHPKTKIWKNIENPSDFYFIHSYMIPFNELKNIKDIDSGVKLGFTDYSTRFVSYIENNRIFGVQFHPEKSQKNGLNFIKNFINLDE